MKCPFCRKDNIEVIKTVKYDTVILRYRRCLSCENSFKTYESYDESIVVEHYSFTVPPKSSK